MLSSTSVRSYLHLHFLVMIWGFTAIVGLMVTISPVALVLYRTLLNRAMRLFKSVLLTPNHTSTPLFRFLSVTL